MHGARVQAHMCSWQLCQEPGSPWAAASLGKERTRQMARGQAGGTTPMWAADADFSWCCLLRTRSGDAMGRAGLAWGMRPPASVLPWPLGRLYTYLHLVQLHCLDGPSRSLICHSADCPCGRAEAVGLFPLWISSPPIQP